MGHWEVLPCTGTEDIGREGRGGLRVRVKKGVEGLDGREGKTRDTETKRTTAKTDKIYKH